MMPLLPVALPAPAARRAPIRQLALRLVLAASVGAGSQPAAAQVAAPPSAPPPPNIVVFLVDDMGVMDTSVPFLTGADGRPVRYPLNDYYRTPNMERLATRGIRFSNFLAMSVCSPTRISIMTGQNAARHRTTNWIDPVSNNRDAQGPPDWNWRGLTKASVTLPLLLRAAGYRTIHVGKAHFGPNGSEGADPLTLGFDVNVGGRAIGHPGSYYGRDAYGKGGTHAVPHLDRYHGTETFLTDALTLEAEARVADAVRERRPFFLSMAHYAVHAPFQSDPRYAAHYAASGKPAPAQAYATLIEGMDASLGRLLEQIDKLGVAGNTLILFLGDNGSDAPLGHQHAVASAAPLRGKKGSHYEGGMRVPFIAAWARPDPANPHQRRLPIAAGAMQGQLASVCDLFPTVLAAAGVAPPAGHVVDGTTLDVLLTGRRDSAKPDEFLMHFPHEHRTNYFTAYRRGDWKVVYHYIPSDVSGGSHYQLFNLAKDPFESTDVAAAEPARLGEMLAALKAGLERHGALYPVGADGHPLAPVLPRAAQEEARPDAGSLLVMR
jgi:arylsulfatase A-like enzyme